MQKGDILKNTYLIEREINRGGMGVLYLARHSMLTGLFAIKTLLPERMHNANLRQRFLAEINAHTQMLHPNIVRVVDCFEENEKLYVVMDYIDGIGLDRKIQQTGPLPEKNALALLRPVLEAIQYAHQRHFVHRDIKPSNILLDNEEIPRVTDFGIAVDNTAATRLTNAASAPIGTACYMSPEQIQTPLQIDARSDIYALGILLYEMLAGEVPFDGETEFAIYQKHINQPIPDLSQRVSGVSKQVLQIVQTATKKKPAERFQSCAEFISAIDAITSPQPKPSKAVYYLLALLFVSAPLIYWLLPKQVQLITDPQQQHETAYAMIEGAEEQISIYCIKQAELSPKKTNLEIAQQQGYYDLIDSYKNQIADINATLQDSQKKFDHFIVSLNKISSDIVAEEFDHYQNLLQQSGKANHLDKLQRLRQNYQRNALGVDAFC
jgi:serine/threonine protein kinase